MNGFPEPSNQPNQLNSPVSRWEGTEIGLIPSVSRRQLLAMLGLSASAVVAGCSSNEGDSTTAIQDRSAASEKPSNEDRSGKSAGKSDKTNTAAGGKKAPHKAATGKTLVVIEVQGGMDGFATLIPYGDGRFRKLRERIWIDQKELVMLDDTYAVPKGLAKVHSKLAFVEGVGVALPDFSHFDMMRRWWMGDPDGKANPAAGFLGRCCDRVMAGEAITGVSLGGGSTPTLLSEKASTVSVPALDLVREIAKQEPSEKRLRDTLRRSAEERNGAQTGAGSEADHLAELARINMGSGLDLLQNFTRLGERDKSYPEGNDLATSLAMVRQLISLDIGMQIFHIPWGSFDTHTDQIGNHSSQIEQFGAALDVFLSDVKAAGLEDRVLVATTSEFGRRPEANGNGTDHGTASTMMLAGAVNPGRYGSKPDFSKLDESGNVRATTSLNDYYATIAQGWLGVPTSEVLSGNADVIDGLLKV
jgi:uncharacterized protein (DUF1501 family)